MVFQENMPMAYMFNLSVMITYHMVDRLISCLPHIIEIGFTIHYINRVSFFYKYTIYHRIRSHAYIEK